MSRPVTPAERGLCEFRNITIEDVTIVGARRVFSAVGLPEKPIRNVKWVNVTADAVKAGVIESARDWTMKNVELRTTEGKPVQLINCNNVEPPEVTRR